MEWTARCSLLVGSFVLLGKGVTDEESNLFSQSSSTRWTYDATYDATYEATLSALMTYFCATPPIGVEIRIPHDLLSGFAAR